MIYWSVFFLQERIKGDRLLFLYALSAIRGGPLFSRKSSLSPFLCSQEEIHSAINGKAGRSVSFDHLVFFIENVIQAAEDLEARGKIEGYGGIKEGITGQSLSSGSQG